MSCLNLAFLENLIVWVIIVAAIVAVIKLLLPPLNSFTPFGIPLGQIVMIILYAIIAILIVYLIFSLLACLLGSGPPFHTLRP
jgi:hypothetical protein